jgi:hypothetical protein
MNKMSLKKKIEKKTPTASSFKTEVNGQAMETKNLSGLQGEDLERLFVQVAAYVRSKLLNDGENEDLQGCCVEASDTIKDILEPLGYECEFVEGWCVYEDDSSCTDRCYDEHSWIECEGYYIDATASQFNSCFYHKLPDIIVSKKRPSCMQKEEPDYKWLDEEVIEDEEY